jgi:hypothetical protein
MPLANFTRLAQEQPLRVLLVNAGAADTLTWSGLVQPLRLAAKLLGADRLQIDTVTPAAFDVPSSAPGSAPAPASARSMKPRPRTSPPTGAR